jgi:Spy/CpxP family protein refolding chaperone
MKKTKIKIIMILAVLIASFGTMQVKAQGMCEHHWKEGMHCGMGKGDNNMAFLNDLTPEQQKQIDALKLNLIKERISVQNLIDEKKAHLKTISTGDNVDLVAVNKTIDELFVLKADMAKKHETFKQDVRKLLTAEQKVMFDIHAGKGRGEGKGQGCGMKGMGNGGCRMEGNGPGMGMGMGNGEMKDCKQMGPGSKCCKERMGDGQGDGKMQGCEKHGQGDGNGPGCCKKK